MDGDSDSHSAGPKRREFLKGFVGGMGLGVAGTGAVVVSGTTISALGGDDGQPTYVAIEDVGGPAPRGMPQIPITIDTNGYLKGVWPTENEAGGNPAKTTIGGVTYSSSWFQYCGGRTSPGLDADADRDNYLRAASGSPYSWQETADTSAGDRLHIDDFSDYTDWTNGIGKSGLGKPAMATWRSVDLLPEQSIPVHVLRSTRVEGLFDPDHPLSEWIQATTANGFIAWLNRCTNHCCVPGFKAFSQSAEYGGEDLVYCQCFGSLYDPFSLVTESLADLQRIKDE